MKNFVALTVLLFSFSIAAETIFLRSQSIDPRSVAKNQEQIKTDVPFLIQVEGPITNDLKSELSYIGVTILRYIPNNSFLVKVKETEAIEKIKNLSFFKHMIAYKPEYKFIPVRQDVEEIYTVIFFNGQISTLFADTSILETISENPEVEFIEKYNQIIPMYMDLGVKADKSRAGDYSDLDGSESGLHLLNAEPVYDNLGLIGKTQIVGMADTGLDVGKIDNSIHPDFRDAVVHGYNASLLSVVAPDQWNDPMGHGTHCAGSIMGRGTASRGKIHGTAPGAKIVVASFWAPFINMMLVNPDFAGTFGTSYAKGARISSNSWGGGQTPGAYDESARTMDQISWEKQDFLLVFAAGNSGVDADKDGKIDSGSLSSPGTAKNVLTVGASENNTSTGGIQVPVSQFNGADQNWGAEPIWSDKISNNENGLAMFSSRGPALDGRIKPDVVAPGTNILSARSHAEGAEVLWGEYNNDYVWSGGTSMATPLTAGAAVIVREYFELEHNLRFIPSALIKATLINGAFDLYPGQYGFGQGQEILTPRPNSDQGWGRVDLANSIVINKDQNLFFDNSQGLSTGQSQEYSISVTNSTRPLRVTMAYTDYPGAASAGLALVNNLDMKVITPQGKAIFPNNLNGPDSVNNVEGVEIRNPQSGTYKIIVSAYNVPQGDNYGNQPFSIVATY